MNMHNLSKLDIEKFRKIYAHVQRGVNDGERDNARRLAEKLAASAGMTFDEAVKSIDASAQATENEGYGDWRDVFRQTAQEKDERRQKRQQKRDAVLARYGNIFRVFEPTDKERKLRRAVSPFSQFTPYRTPAGGKSQYTSKLDKCRKIEIDLGDLSKRARKAIETAYPIPDGLADVLAELIEWDQLAYDRKVFTEQNEWNLDMEVMGRLAVLRNILRNKPASSWDDIQARFEWEAHHWRQQWIWPEEHEREDDEFLKRVQSDLMALRERYDNQSVQVGQPETSDEIRTMSRSNADIRKAVLSMLYASPELSDREISRRVGVSPQTVNNWRRRQAQTDRSAA